MEKISKEKRQKIKRISNAFTCVMYGLIAGISIYGSFRNNPSIIFLVVFFTVFSHTFLFVVRRDKYIRAYIEKMLSEEGSFLSKSLCFVDSLLDRIINKKNIWILSVGVALLFGLISARLSFMKQDPNLLTTLTWFGSLFFVILAGLLHDRFTLPRGEGELATTTCSLRQEDIAQEKRKLFYWYDWISVIVLTVCALGIRLYKLGDFLPTIHGDEGEMGLLALIALHGSDAITGATRELPLFATGFLGHPTLFHYLQALSMWLFGETFTGLRILSVIFGALCIPCIYTITRIGWGYGSALLAGWLLTISHLHIHYSRIALNNIQSVFFMLLVAALLFLVYGTIALKKETLTYTGTGLQPKSAIGVSYYILTGLCAGLSIYFYFGSRFIPIYVMMIFVYMWLTKCITLKQILFFVVSFCIALFPLIGFFYKVPYAFIERTNTVAVFSENGMKHTLGPSASWPYDIPRFIVEQLKRNWGFFLQQGDNSAFYARKIPGFDYVTAGLFWFGVAFLLMRWKRFPEFALLSWALLGVTIAGVMTNDSPNTPRLIVVTSFVYIIASIPLKKIFNITGKTRAFVIMPVVMTIIMGVTFFENFRLYFEKFPKYAGSQLMVNILQDMERFGSKYRSYLFGEPLLYVDYGTFRFGARTIERRDGRFLSDIPILDSDELKGKGILVFTLLNHLDIIENLKKIYPEGHFERRYDEQDRHLYDMYRVDPKNIYSLQESETQTEYKIDRTQGGLFFTERGDLGKFDIVHNY